MEESLAILESLNEAVKALKALVQPSDPPGPMSDVREKASAAVAKVGFAYAEVFADLEQGEGSSANTSLMERQRTALEETRKVLNSIITGVVFDKPHRPYQRIQCN